jgi:CBS domain containing-hemolysin-like protein
VDEEIDCEGWRFRIVALDGKRIDRVTARSIAAAPHDVDA